MEDSYTVHRRRKAAARKREKTPEAPRRGQDDVAATDDDEDARARMERMVQETERLEELEELARRRAELEKAAERGPEKPQRVLKRAMSPEVRRAEEEARMADENFEPEATVQVLTLGVRSSAEKASKNGARRASGAEAETAERAKELGADAARKSRRDEIDAEESSRAEVRKDRSPETAAKPVRSTRKALSPEVEKREKNRTSPRREERTRDAGESTRARKASRTSDKENDEDAAELDGNRRGTSAEARDAEAGSADKPGGKSESAGNREARETAEDAGRAATSRKGEERSAEDRRRDVTSPSKLRNSETRLAAENREAREAAEAAGRAGTARKVEERSAEDRRRDVTSPSKMRNSETRLAAENREAREAAEAVGRATSSRKGEERSAEDRRRDVTSPSKMRNSETRLAAENREARETAEDAGRAGAPRKGEERSAEDRRRDVTSPSKTRNSETRLAATKRAPKERNVESTGYTTDSSDTEEKAKRKLRRKKSPEDAKTRSSAGRKTPSRSRVTTDTDGDADERETGKRTERTSGSRRRRGSDTDDDARESASRSATRQAEKFRSGERRSSSRPQPPSDTDDDRRVVAVRKSGTFPVDPPRDRSPKIGRSASDARKQIIPLSDDSLIEDLEKAQQEYLRKERGILDRDPLDDYVDPRMEAALRRRKFSIVQTEVEAREIAEKSVEPTKRSWLGWIPFVGRFAERNKSLDRDETKDEVKREEPTLKTPEVERERPPVAKEAAPEKKVSIIEFFRTLVGFVGEFRAFVEQNPRETRNIRVMRNRCMAELLLAIIYCGLGAFVFRFTEGAFETFYKCGVKRVKRDFLDSLWNFSHNMREEDWKSMARRKLMEFEEQLHTAHEAGVHSYSGQKSWSFLNAVVYCLTVITTIGYGHIYPSTTTGRAITIVYAIFGIPMFLIILADFGKLFTRGIKFLWAFVRRVYYTGSCRRVRRTAPVQEVMKGVQLVYDLATFRRPSQMNPEQIEEMEKQQNQTQTVLNLDGNAPASAVPPDTPGTPAMSTFAIDDEFNLPISVAIFILLVYIFVGATVYNFWEEWSFFESFYFVFISMSTIGFGDYVPKHPIYMMLSIIYLVFGLALTSMCINVVQVMLSDSFKQASQKIGATIGFEVAEDEDESAEPAEADAVELADVHTTIKESESKEQVAPKAKQEDVEL